MIRVDKTKLPYLEAGQQSRILTLVYFNFHFNKGYGVSHNASGYKIDSKLTLIQTS